MKGTQSMVPTYYQGGVNFTGWQYICGGSHYSCGLLKNGTIDCWGRGQYGQLDVPGQLTYRGPSSGVSGVPWRQVQCGSQNACGTLQNGTTLCWGFGMQGENDAPSEDWLGISFWEKHGCGITAAGSVKCWGRNTYGELYPPSFRLQYCVTDQPIILQSPAPYATVSAAFNLTLNLPEPATFVRLDFNSVLGDNITLWLKADLWNTTAAVGTHQVTLTPSTHTHTHTCVPTRPEPPDSWRDPSSNPRGYTLFGRY